MSNEFSWNDPDILVIARTEAVAVYANAEGNIVIRQERVDLHDQEDQVVIFPRSRAADVIAAIQKAVAECEN